MNCKEQISDTPSFSTRPITLLPLLHVATKSSFTAVLFYVSASNTIARLVPPTASLPPLRFVFAGLRFCLTSYPTTLATEVIYIALPAIWESMLPASSITPVPPSSTATADATPSVSNTFTPEPAPMLCLMKSPPFLTSSAEKSLAINTKKSRPTLCGRATYLLQ